MNQPETMLQGSAPAKSRLQKATIGDIALSVIIPGWGILIGLIALIKREFKRGLTMIAIGVVMVAIYTALGLFRAP
ncbi:MAG TPA: hypothetical protein VGM16_08585 [Gammaproteobacteria bacterium]|jgi:hypothetical protein